MIIRILNEGQYNLNGNDLSTLDELDSQLTEAISSNDEIAFQQTFTQMLTTVRSGGERLSDYTLTESELILPAPDTTLKEAQLLFTGQSDDLT